MGSKSILIHMVIFLVMSTMIIDDELNGQSQGNGGETYITEWGSFRTTSIVEIAGNFLGGSDIADIDEDGRRELVIGGGGTKLYIVEYDNGKWVTTSVDTQCNGIITVEIGPVMGLGPKDKVLFGGFSNELIAYDCDLEGDDAFSTLMEFDERVWDIKVGEIIPQKEGPEIVVAHSSENISVLFWESGSWNSMILKAAGPVTTLLIGEADEDRPGLELLCGSENGDLEIFYWNGVDFQKDLIFKGDRAIRKLTIGDFNDHHPGNELITVSYSFNSGNATMFWREDGIWENKFLYNSTRGLEALSLGEFNPVNPGLEFVFAGYAYTVTMVVKEGPQNVAVDIWKGSNKLGDLTNEIVAVTVGDLYPGNKGDEVFILGSYGSVRMTMYEDPNCTLVFDEMNEDLVRGSNVSINGEILSLGGFEGEVSIEYDLLVKDRGGVFIPYEDDDITFSSSERNDVYPGYSTPLYSTLRIGENADATEYRIMFRVESVQHQDIWNETYLQFRITDNKPYKVRINSFWHDMKDDGSGLVTLLLENTGEEAIENMKVAFILNNASAGNFDIDYLDVGKEANISFIPDLKDGNNTITFQIQNDMIDLENKDGTTLFIDREDGIEGSQNNGLSLIIFVLIIILITIPAAGFAIYKFSNKNK